MGARGNSGVITSQILRGLCEGSAHADALTTDTIADAFEKSVEVAFQAVRKPVEGTILTVLRDSAEAAVEARRLRLDTETALETIVSAAYDSVQRTPDLLPVLKENGVVDAGGFGLAILFDAFASALLGKEGTLGDELAFAHGRSQGRDRADQRLGGLGFPLLQRVPRRLRRARPRRSARVPHHHGRLRAVRGQRAEVQGPRSLQPPRPGARLLPRARSDFRVFIHNMQLQSEERTEKLAAEQAQERKPLGFVAVAAGSGNAEILKSLGVDVVVSGGQTMNPSTKDLLDAMTEVNADAVIVLPNNSNIIMAAQSACELAEFPCGVVPTKSMPQAFAAMFAVAQEADLEENIAEMTAAYADVRTGEVTTAIKDSKDAHDNPIKEGDVIGISDGAIEAVASTVEDAVMRLLEVMEAADADTLTILAGEGFHRRGA